MKIGNRPKNTPNFAIILKDFVHFFLNFLPDIPVRLLRNNESHNALRDPERFPGVGTDTTNICLTHHSIETHENSPCFEFH